MERVGRRPFIIATFCAFDSVEARAVDLLRIKIQLQLFAHDAGKEATRYALLYAAVGFAGDDVEHDEFLGHPDGRVVERNRVADDGDRRPMLRHETGLFDLLLKDRREVFKYRLEVHYPGGGVFTLRQPYAFLPTLGDLDLHLWSEGKHERAWERLGARQCEELVCR